MPHDKQDAVVYQYLLVEIQGARTNILALGSSSIALLALSIALFSNGLGDFGIAAVALIAVLLFFLDRYMRYLETVKGIAKGYAVGSRHQPLREALRLEVLPKEVRIPTYRRKESTEFPRGVILPQVGATQDAVSRARKLGASIIVFAAVLVWAAGFVGEREFGTGVWFWVYWEAILFLAVWTFERAGWLVLGKTKHTIWMFDGRVLSLMFLASILFVFAGPLVLAFTLNLTLGVGIMLAGIVIWFVAAVDWVRYEHGQNQRQDSG